MAKSKVLLDFINDSVPVKIQYTRDRVIDMTGNANFPDPPGPDVDLGDWGASATDLETKYNAAQGGGPAQTELQDAAELVHRMLAELAPRDRLVLTLSYLEQRKVAEVAELTGWSRTMVKVQLHRARKRLAKICEMQGIEL